jgi:DNA topoisomerase-1
MSNNLVIVESPAKASTIKKYLGKNYKVVASMGHLRDLPKSQLGVDIENNFNPKYVTIRGKGDLLSKLKKEAKASKKVFLATDPDREGEAISWHLAKALNIEENNNCRITFNEITKNAVKTAIKEPRKIDQNLVDAQQARRILDRIVGYKISPLLWKKVKKGLSAGRVQSVALRLISARETEISNFIPQEYWNIKAKVYNKNCVKPFEARFYGENNKKIKLSTKDDVNTILKKIEGKEFVVNNVKTGLKYKHPAPPFITSTLQQEGSRKCGFSSKKTMIIAQQLYEGINVPGHGTIGLITYMRTDSTRISQDAQKDALEYIEKEYGKEYVPDVPRVFKSKRASQDAHEAIRPTSVLLTPKELKKTLKPEQYKLYKLIWERFIASQMKSAEYNTVNIDISVGECIFKATGSTIKFKGFMVLYIEGVDEEKKEDESYVPILSEGEKLQCKDIEDTQHFTQPPSRFTEATLVRELEEKGIGRPSTYAPTISTIISRGYIKREKKTLIPTELGLVIDDIMRNNFVDIVDVEFTANMEKELDAIEEGKEDWVKILKDFYNPFEKVLEKAEKEIEKIHIAYEETDVICEKCGRNMVIKFGRYGKFLACPGFPECRNAKPIIDKIDVKCPLCRSDILLKKTKKGRKYYECEKYPECTLRTWDEPYDQKCPECGSVLVKKGNKDNIKLKCINENCNYEGSI